ncbi:BLUF domain-containing protein [Brevundimonas sp.]
MEKTLIRLVYRSESLISHDDNAGLRAIFQTSNRNNKRDHITGALALPDGKFVQVVEGARDKVELLMGRVRADARHEDIVVLGEWEVRSRLFPSWNMAQPDPAPLSEQAFRIITESDSGAQVTAILLDLTAKGDRLFASI